MPQRPCELCTSRPEHRRGLCRRCYRLVLACGWTVQGFTVPDRRAPGPARGTGTRPLEARVTALVRRWSPEVRKAVLEALRCQEGAAS